MARQVSDLKMTGTFGEVILYYTRDDGYLVRSKGSLDRKRFYKDKAFAAARNNSAEFGLCSAAGRLIRGAVNRLLPRASDRHVTGRLIGELTKLKRYDAHSAHGRRSVAKALEHEAARKELEGFEMNRNVTLGSVLKAGYMMDAGKGRIRMRRLDAQRDVKAPAGATHMCLTLAAARINFENGHWSTAYSQPYMIGVNRATQDIILEAGAPEGEGMLLLYLHACFYREEKGSFALAGEGRCEAMRIVAVEATAAPAESPGDDGKNCDEKRRRTFGGSSWLWNDVTVGRSDKERGRYRDEPKGGQRVGRIVVTREAPT